MPVCPNILGKYGMLNSIDFHKFHGYGKFRKILHSKVSDKMAYANSACHRSGSALFAT